jgi:hypothetical protein
MSGTAMPSTGTAVVAIAEFDVAHKEFALVSKPEALKEFGRATEAYFKAEHRLMLAAAMVQATQAWDDDDAFMAALAGGQYVKPEKLSWFQAYLGWRWGYKPTPAAQLSRAGRVVDALSRDLSQSATTSVQTGHGSLPANEFVTRPLAKVLNQPDGETRVRQVWAKAQELAVKDKKPAPTEGHVTRAIKDLGMAVSVPKARGVATAEDVERKVREVRAAVNWLLQHATAKVINELAAWIERTLEESDE